MCIISGAVEDVKNTQILVGCTEDRQRQLTVYENKVHNRIPQNAMILPVPYPGSIQFHDLTTYADIFTVCSRSFQSMLKSNSLSYEAQSFGASDSLPVLEVGSYQVSLARSLADLDRVDASVFRLTGGCRATLAQYYVGPIWGFIICQLRQGDCTYHPLAYSHNILAGRYFIPTRHYHEHPAPLLRTYARDLGATSHTSHGEDWDHTIYVYNGMPSGIPPTKSWTGQCHLDRAKLRGLGFGLAGPTSFECADIKGGYVNKDLLIAVA